MVCSTLSLPQRARPVLGTDLNRSESTPGRTAAVCSTPRLSRICYDYQLYPSSFGHAGALARAIASPHHNRDTRGLRRDSLAGGERRSGSANFWQHLSRKEKNSIARKIRCRFEFDLSKAKTHCFANVLDVR